MSNQTFADFSLAPKMMKAIDEMGFTEATDIQAESIPLIRTGVDVLAQSHTGSGKTMAFAIPAVESIDAENPNVQVLVLSPTRELAQQCGDEVRKISKYMQHIKTADVYGGADFSPQFRALKTANIVIGTPGRIMDHMRRASLKLDNLKMVILDEADEMLNMGFKEDIETILQDVPETRQIVLFSATIPDGILQITKQFQNNPVSVKIVQDEVSLANITQHYVEVPMYRKPEAMKLLVEYYRPRRSIVFANTKSMVDDLVDLLNEMGVTAQGLHGDMKQAKRTSVMQAFKKGKVSILVATDVAARGIDVSDVDYVINFDIPKINEYYVHRIGRTGRAGRTGTAITLCCGRRQVVLMQQMGRKLKFNIDALPLPTVQDIEKQNLEKNIERMTKALSKEQKEIHVEMLKMLTEQGFSAEEIAVAAMRIAFKRNNIKSISVKASKEAVGGEEKSGKFDKRERVMFSDVLINMGSSNRITPNHVVGAFAECAGIRGKSVGKIEISEDFTVVGVPSDELEDIVEAMKGAKICGKPVTVTPLADKTNKKSGKPSSQKPSSKRDFRGNFKKRDKFSSKSGGKSGKFAKKKAY